MYFSQSNASKALQILADAGHKAEPLSASRPTGRPVRWMIVVQAPHLPRLDGKVQTVGIRTPSELLGWGATQAHVDHMNKLEAAGVC